MTDQSAAPSGGSDISVVSLPADAPESFTSEHDAARYFATMHEKKPAAERAEPEQAATAEQELSGEDNAAPLEADHGEDEGADTVKEPPIARPKSWSQDEDAEWEAIPRARQEKIAANELARDTDRIRKLNEVADERKAVKAEREATEKVRQQLEVEVKAARSVLEREQREKFPDIKNWEDYQRLSAEASRLVESDPFTALRIGNYLKDFDTHQMSMQMNARQEKQLEDQKSQERNSKRVTYESEQTKLLHEMVPDMADPKKAAEKRERAVAMLTDDLGLKMETLQRWMQDDIGHEILSSAGIQKLIANQLEFKDFKSAPKAVVDPKLPPVQRPGAARPQGQAAAENAKTSLEKLNNSGDLKDAVALLQARRGRR